MRLALPCLLLLATSPALAADGLVAVLPIDAATASVTPADRIALEETVRSTTADALSPRGYTVLTGETTLEVLRQNGIDPARACEASCALDAARELDASLFLSGTLMTSEGQHIAFLRLFESATGRQVSSVQVEGTTMKDVRDRFVERAPGLFRATSRDGSATPVAEIAPPTITLEDLFDVGGLQRGDGERAARRRFGEPDRVSVRDGLKTLEYERIRLEFEVDSLARIEVRGLATLLPAGHWARLVGAGRWQVVQSIAARPTVASDTEITYEHGSGAVRFQLADGRATSAVVVPPIYVWAPGSSERFVSGTVSLTNVPGVTLVDEAGLKHTCPSPAASTTCELDNVALGLALVSTSPDPRMDVRVDLLQGTKVDLAGGVAGTHENTAVALRILGLAVGAAGLLVGAAASSEQAVAAGFVIGGAFELGSLLVNPTAPTPPTAYVTRSAH